MPRNIKHEMTINEVDNKLEVLLHIVDYEFEKTIEEARKYLDECRGIGDE